MQSGQEGIALESGRLYEKQEIGLSFRTSPILDYLQATRLEIENLEQSRKILISLDEQRNWSVLWTSPILDCS